MKENKGKEVVGEGSHPEVQPQTRPSTGDKRKTLPKNLDLGSLPNRRGKKAKHGSSQVVKSSLPSSQLSVQIFYVDSSTPIVMSKTPPSKTTAPALSQPCEKIPTNIIENEDLACERFQIAVLDKDINTYYDISLKEFEHSGVHDLFKVRLYLYFVFVQTIFPCLTIFCFLLFYRPCQNLSRRPGRPQDWIRRGFC